MEALNARPSRPIYAWLIVFAAFLCFGVVYGTTLYAFPVFVKPVSDAFHVSRTQVLFGFTLLNVGAGILGIAAGPAVARFGIRNAVVAGLVLLAAGFFLLSIVHTLTPFYAIYAIIIAFASSMVSNIGASALVANWFVADRGRALTVAILGTSFGQMFIPPFIAKVIAANGLEGGYRTLAVIMIAAAIPVALLAVDHPEKRGMQAWGAETAPVTADTPQAPIPSTGEILRRPDFWVVGATYLFAVIVYLGLGATLVPYALTFGVANTEAAKLAAISGLAAMIGKIGFASFTDRMGLRNTFWIAIALNLVAIAALLLMHDYDALYVAAACVGASAGGMLPVWPGLVAQRFGRRALPKVMGLMSPMIVSLQGFGAPLVQAMHFQPAYVLFGGSLLLSAVISLGLSKPAPASA
ncbi:MAG TPA: MFS transporter [Caulobacteraceae bacterium]|nr:MFS transporter [Caulobacteraceae bacterium]